MAARARGWLTSYAMLSSEVFMSDVAALNEALLGNEALLQEFFRFLERPAPLDPIRVGYFCRILMLLLQKKTSDVRRRVGNAYPACA